MNKNLEKPHIIIAGAGSIGCFVGGLLLAAGQNVSFVGRKRIADELSDFGLKLTDYTGMNLELPAKTLNVSVKPEVFNSADIILVTVKSGATASIAREIKDHAPGNATVVSLQNGVRNADAIRDILPKHDVRAGMVPFNVVQMGRGRFHRGTSGEIVVETGNPNLSENLNTAYLPVKSSSDMRNIQWGKLLINLNNAINAISGLTLLEQLSNRGWRARMANQMKEAMRVMKAAGINPKPPAPVPAWVIPHILRLPTSLFRILAKQMITIDPEARSSMWEDIQRGRKTEIDELQGEIIKLGKEYGEDTPINRRIYDQIRELEGN